MIGLVSSVNRCDPAFATEIMFELKNSQLLGRTGNFIYENAAFVKGWDKFSIRKYLLDESPSGCLPTQSGPAGYIYARSSRKSMFRKRVAIIRRISRIQKIHALTLAWARPSGE
jgi:hypothetical protein